MTKKLMKSIQVYHDERAIGRDSESAAFKTNWEQRKKALDAWLVFSKVKDADSLITEVQGEIENKQRVESRLLDWYETLATTIMKNGKTMSGGGARNKVMMVAAFYTANRVQLRTKAIPKSGTSEARKVYANHPAFDYDKEGIVTGFNKSAKEFFNRLPFKFRVVCIASASSGQPASVILGLTVGEAKRQIITSDRIILMADRTKTSEPYMTYISEEATGLIKIYLDKERKDAQDNEPLFMATAGRPMLNTHIAKATKRIAEKMGIIDNGINPFKPYRMRQMFRTAIDSIPTIPDSIKKTMMGHAKAESEGYSTTSTSAILPHYLKVERLLALQRDLTGIEKDHEDRVKTLERDNASLRYDVQLLAKHIHDSFDGDPEAQEVFKPFLSK